MSIQAPAQPCPPRDIFSLGDSKLQVGSMGPSCQVLSEEQGVRWGPLRGPHPVGACMGSRRVCGPQAPHVKVEVFECPGVHRLDRGSPSPDQQGT